MTQRQMYNQMLRIHENTEAKIVMAKWYFENPDKMWMRIDKPKFINALFLKYKDTSPINDFK